MAFKFVQPESAPEFESKNKSFRFIRPEPESIPESMPKKDKELIHKTKEDFDILDVFIPTRALAKTARKFVPGLRDVPQIDPTETLFEGYKRVEEAIKAPLLAKVKGEPAIPALKAAIKGETDTRAIDIPLEAISRFTNLETKFTPEMKEKNPYLYATYKTAKDMSNVGFEFLSDPIIATNIAYRVGKGIRTAQKARKTAGLLRELNIDKRFKAAYKEVADKMLKKGLDPIELKSPVFVEKIKKDMSEILFKQFPEIKTELLQTLGKRGVIQIGKPVFTPEGVSGVVEDIKPTGMALVRIGQALTELPLSELKEPILETGQPVKVGKSPQKFTIEKQLESTLEEKALGESFYEVKNEKTGEIQTVEREDLKEIVGKKVVSDIPELTTTEQAEKFGRDNVENTEVLQELDRLRAENKQKARDLLEKPVEERTQEDLNNAMRFGTKAQLYRESLEAAKKTITPSITKPSGIDEVIKTPDEAKIEKEKIIEQTAKKEEPVDLEVQGKELKELNEEYEIQKDIWIGNKDVRILKSNIEKSNLQNNLRTLLNKKKYDIDVKNIDKAIQLYIDTKRNPEHVKKFIDKLSPEQKKLVELSQNLPDEVKTIADNISESYKNIGLEAQEADIIKNTLDNYVNRVWELPKDAREKFRKFGTSTRHAKQRVFETMIEGMAKGYTPKIEGATNNLQILKEEMTKTIEDKKFIKALSKLTDVEGNKLLTTKFLDGYKKVEHPNFKVWRHAGTAVEGKTYGKNFFIDDKGNLFEKQELYAPEKQAKNLNNILGVSKIKDLPAVPTITKYNAIMKSWILQSSLFHHLAYMRSYWLGTNHKKFSEMSIRQAYRQGLRAITEENPMIIQGVRNGLTLGLKQDWNEDLLKEETAIGNLLDKWKVSKKVKDKILDLRQSQADFLFGKLGAGLKAKSYIIEMTNMLKKHPEEDIDKLSRIVANLINDDFGGLHLQRLGRSPTVQHVFRLFALAPDWCVPSDTRAMTKTGWKYYHELKVEQDEVLAFNPKTNKYQWSKLNDMYVNKKFDSKIIEIPNHNRSIKMTPEHKCYVYNNSKKKHEIVLAKDINTAHSIPTCANFDLATKKIFNDDFIHLVGWVVTDGYFKKNKNTLKNGETKIYLYAKIVQSKPIMVEHLKSLGLKYSIDNTMKEHNGIVSNYPKYVFNIPLKLNNLMLSEHLDKGLSWEFLSKLTKEQLGILYDSMMLGDGTGQNRFCGKEKEIFFMTLIQTMLGLPSTFYKQEKNCWRTRIVMRENIGCQNKIENQYKGTIWCPSVDTGFWLAEREGLVFITGNTESNIRSMVKAFRAGDKIERRFYQRFWAGIFTKGILMTVLANILINREDFVKNYKKAWEAGKLRWLDVDVTNIYKAVGGTTKNRKYFSILGHFKDPLKFASHPIRSIQHKSSVIYKIFHEALTGENWQGKTYTKAGELLKEGATVKWKFGGGKPLSFDQIPSFLLGQIKGAQPVQIQNLLSWLAGEMEGFDALLNSLGIGIRSTYGARKKKGVFRFKRAKRISKKYKFKLGLLILYIFLPILSIGCVTTRTTRFYVDGKEKAKISAYGAGSHEMKVDGNVYKTDSKTSSLVRDTLQLYTVKMLNED